MMAQDPGIAEALPASIGSAVRAARLARGESMRAVAARAGISQPMLSKVEHGQLLPSLTTVYAIAAALGVGPGSLLPLVTAGASEPLHLPTAEDPAGDAVTRVELLSGGSGAGLQVYLLSGESGSADPSDFVHDGQEFAYVLDGAITLRTGGSTRELRTGESASYDASRPHRVIVRERARVLLVSTA